MIVFSKKKKIKRYLDNKSVENRTPFEHLLQDYLDGLFKKQLIDIGLNKIDIHIDWSDNYKCIGIQAKYNQYFVDCQIFEDEFSLSFDLDEADDDTIYSFESKEYFYKTLNQSTELL